MLENLYLSTDLKDVYTNKRMKEEIISVNKLLVDSYVADGWIINKELKHLTKLSKDKQAGMLLEDRVWCVLYKMGFNMLSGSGGARLSMEGSVGKNQIDIIAVDNEVALAIECKSSEKIARKIDFDKDIAKFNTLREKFVKSIHNDFCNDIKKTCAMILFTDKIIVNESQRSSADEQKIQLLNEKDLEYYERLADYLGTSAKYQFLGDIFKQKSIPGLELRIPAIKGRMGGYNCYTFSISPEYLLKIAYVSHRSRNQDSDDTYQRMISKSRLTSIRKYITGKGIFPTNIVVSLDQAGKNIRFDQTAQDTDTGNGVMGWLSIRPAFGSAWIIDGQHRLFAFSGHKLARTSMVSVIAFEGLPSDEQAKLFVDINNEQKSVKRSHLMELYSKLRRDDNDPNKRIDAIISNVIKRLTSSDSTSPFYDRIQVLEEPRTFTRCLSMQALFSALNKSDLFISKKTDDGSIISYGPFWAGDNSDDTLKRTVLIINGWFQIIRQKSSDWWDLGSNIEGAGGLAMNDSIIACINVLRSVFSYLSKNGCNCVEISDSNQVIEKIAPFATILGDYFVSFDYNERIRWRDYRGSQGQIMRTRICQEELNKLFPDFNPPGLDEYRATMKAQTNDNAKTVIDNIERSLKNITLQVLKTKFGETYWWKRGIPESIRIECNLRAEKSLDVNSQPEDFFDLIHYREIAMNNWLNFQDIIGDGKGNESKDKRTKWIAFVNEQRKKVSHASRGEYVSLDELSKLEYYHNWFTANISKEPEEESTALGSSEIESVS